jgi:hypothetical protein
MDTLTGQNSSEPNEDRLQQGLDSINTPNNKHISVDKDGILVNYINFDLKEKEQNYNLRQSLFVLASNLDPTKISDEEFVRVSTELSDADFVRALFLAYLKRDATKSEINYWANEIELRKSKRISLPRGFRTTSVFLEAQYNNPQSLMQKLIQGIDRMLWPPISRLIRMLGGIEHLEIIAAINLVREQNDLLLGACIDRPQTGCKIETSQYIIAGWVIGKVTQPSGVRATIQKEAIAEFPISNSRPDVTQAYCLTSNTHNWGFDILLNIKELPSEGDIKLHAVFSDGRSVLFGLIKFRK